jgi:hypothetical protein
MSNNNLIRELLTLCRTGKTELVRENAFQLLLKLQGDSVRGARGAVEAIERSKLWQCGDRKANSQDGHRP